VNPINLSMYLIIKELHTYGPFLESVGTRPALLMFSKNSPSTRFGVGGLTRPEQASPAPHSSSQSSESGGHNKPPLFLFLPSLLRIFRSSLILQR
jgi:hypothetical protein